MLRLDRNGGTNVTHSFLGVEGKWTIKHDKISSAV